LALNDRNSAVDVAWTRLMHRADNQVIPADGW
jgi:hypothetical protein